ncbi:MAG: ROK family protein [Chitinophagaceae bacterium]|nr:ROK family protein [Chitinophagaceae bacterium]
MTLKEKILCIDIGGSRIKATLLDKNGHLLDEYKKLNTPDPSTPGNVLNTIKELAGNFKGYQKISVGFPGYIKKGVVITAPNLGTAQWTGTDLASGLNKLLGKPCRVVNDADLQGLGIASGKGLEMVVTLGTGFGTALLDDGRLLPHLELAHHPVTKLYTYDMYIGEKALLKYGVKRWNKRMIKVIAILKKVFNYDRLYISGGNAKKLTCKPDGNIVLANNLEGIKGGARLWK